MCLTRMLYMFIFYVQDHSCTSPQELEEYTFIEASFSSSGLRKTGTGRFFTLLSAWPPLAWKEKKKNHIKQKDTFSLLVWACISGQTDNGPLGTDIYKHPPPPDQIEWPAQESFQANMTGLLTPPEQKSCSSTHFVLLGQAPAVGLHSAVLLLDVSFDLLVLGPLLLSPGHHILSRHSVVHNTSCFTKRSLSWQLPFPPKVKAPVMTHSSLRKSKALLLSLGSCCKALLLFLTDGWICEVGALYFTFTGASTAGFLAAPPDELNKRLKLEV